MPHAITRADEEHINWKASIPMIAFHFVPLLAFVTGVTWTAVILCAVLYVVRMFFITAGYHRYFAHRSYKTSRGFQFVLAVGGATAAQKGPLWWAGHHRDHHRFSDTERDVHSPQKGFWWSHMGWILCDKYKGIDYDRQIKDFAAYPELRWVDKHQTWFSVALGVLCYFIAGWSGVVIGFFASTVLLWHGTFTVNSLNHVFGRRRYATTDTSRNSGILALWTLGEGWHNNHHYYPASARQGFYWWEYDVSFAVLRSLAIVGVVHDLKTPPRWARDAGRVRDGQIDIGMFRAHWQRATTAFSQATAQAGEALTNATTHASDAISSAKSVFQSRPAATDDIAAPTRREQMDDLVRSHRAALEDSIQAAMRHAEELAKATKLQQREVRLTASEQ